jgi:hypothetical protein
LHALLVIMYAYENYERSELPAGMQQQTSRAAGRRRPHQPGQPSLKLKLLWIHYLWEQQVIF